VLILIFLSNSKRPERTDITKPLLPNQWVETNQLFLENYLAILAKEALEALEAGREADEKLLAQDAKRQEMTNLRISSLAFNASIYQNLNNFIWSFFQCCR
jgi:hypothetical protein